MASARLRLVRDEVPLVRRKDDQRLRSLTTQLQRSLTSCVLLRQEISFYRASSSSSACHSSQDILDVGDTENGPGRSPVLLDVLCYPPPRTCHRTARPPHVESGAVIKPPNQSSDKALSFYSEGSTKKFASAIGLWPRATDEIDQGQRILGACVSPPGHVLIGAR